MISYCLIPFSLLYWRKSKDNGRALLKKPVLNCRTDDDIIKSQEAHYMSGNRAQIYDMINTEAELLPVYRDFMISRESEAEYKRNRFYAAATTASHTPKGTDFSDIPQVPLLYITEYDALHNGQMITYVKRCSISKKRKGVLEKCAKR